ncbi:hypothetical protein [Roseimaritima sediminicola]|uniref:hypothetical protein n=1 Tax=Roseimaritima sediminicola TaxID=2662066 RepID=UPI0012982411|nr:hypothetical protein [Roseimaritima sediminicola]
MNSPSETDASGHSPDPHCPHCGGGDEASHALQTQYARLQAEAEQLSRGWLELEKQQRELLQERAKLPQAGEGHSRPARTVAAETAGAESLAANANPAAPTPYPAQNEATPPAGTAEPVDRPATTPAAESPAAAPERLSERVFAPCQAPRTADPPPRLRSLFGLRPRSSPLRP